MFRLMVFGLLGLSFSVSAQTSAPLGSNVFVSSLVEISDSQEAALEAENSKLDRVIFVKNKITYADHLFEASSFQIPMIANFNEMTELIIEHKLVEVPEEGNGYIVQKLTHSKSVLMPVALDILNEISNLFFEQTSKKLSISSLTRTEESQKKLSRVNSNAAKGGSAHAYGAAFDISYSQYNGVAGRNYSHEKLVQKILDNMVAEGKIYYIKERRQPCFHVTVRNPNLVFPDDYPSEDILKLIFGEHNH